MHMPLPDWKVLVIVAVLLIMRVLTIRQKKALRQHIMKQLYVEFDIDRQPDDTVPSVEGRKSHEPPAAEIAHSHKKLVSSRRGTRLGVPSESPNGHKWIQGRNKP
jgi:hypothetical protein